MVNPALVQAPPLLHQRQNAALGWSYCSPRVTLKDLIWYSEQFEFETPGLDSSVGGQIF